MTSKRLGKMFEDGVVDIYEKSVSVIFLDESNRVRNRKMFSFFRTG